MAEEFDRRISTETYKNYLERVEIGTIEKEWFSAELETMCNLISECLDDKRTLNRHHLTGALVYIEYLKQIVDKLNDRETTP